MTYTDEQHRAIAEFAGVWSPQCPNAGWKADGHDYDSAGFPIIDYYVCTSCGEGFTDMEHHDHHGVPPQLDDALALACLRNAHKLGLSVLIQNYDGWYCDVSKSICMKEPDGKGWDKDNNSPRDAIFAAVLAYLAVVKE